MIKGFKIRIYPTKEQEELFWKHIGCCRYIWNYMLDLQQTRYKNGEKHLSAFDMMRLLTPLKKDGEHEWLREVSNTALQRECRDLHDAYKNYFAKCSGHPKFKSRKKAKPSYPVKSENKNFYFASDKFLQIEKVGRVRYKTDRQFQIGRGVGKYSDVRVSYDKVSNKWFVSFCMERENQAPQLTDKSMGIDLGIKELAVVAIGEDEQRVYHNVHKSKKMRELEKRKEHIQRSISRKYEANKVGKKYVKTNNILRQEEELSKVYRRIANINNNYIHQTTHELVSMLPQRIVMEDLNVMGMLKNKHLSRAVGEQCFYEFKRQMQYKCEWYGIELVEADRFYPSSKTCSCCGSIKKDLKLKDRTYICNECGLVIDRDYNAALNLSRYAA